MLGVFPRLNAGEPLPLPVDRHDVTLITAVKDFIRSCGTDGFMSRVAACQCSVRDVCPSSNLGSTSRCNTGVKSLRWGFECQAIEHGADESGEYPKLPLSGAQ